MDEHPELNHIGIIMDGNRRFARRLMLEPWKGHEWGAKKAEDVIDWCAESGIKAATLYSLSYENFNSRPKQELEMLFKLMEKEAIRVAGLQKVHDNKIRFNVIGRPDMLPKNVQEAFGKLTKATENYKNFTINLAIVYGGREEIVDAVKRIAKSAKQGKLDIEKLDESTFGKFLYTNGASDPDLIIRTGGEKRLSGFLLWQSAYSEFYFSDKIWPEFEKDDFVLAIDDFKERKRRFGK
ncbi:Tritrans,polycis-undecaprenyl-diphosphate synthase (GGDP specific) [uncultured archaeon]|nr:Tritrans,polycis-undecaprenyl-diphosphate synthase (GGDP specific) [uncultured archaeon]